jgi:putative ABC transport system permease protein
MLRVSPALGHDFSAEDSKPGAEPVAILGHDIWQARFGGDRSIVGQKIFLTERSYTVIGVLPAGFWFPYQDDGRLLLLPMTIDPAVMQRGAHNTMVFVRLRDGVSKQQAQAEMETIAKRQERLYPNTNSGWGVHLITLRDEMAYRTGMASAMLFGPVVFVLLIACANVGNMLLARAAARKAEIAVRAALGASRTRLLRQLLTESLLLALCAGGVGLLLASQGMHLMTLLAARSGITQFPSLSTDASVLGFCLALVIVTVLMFGLAPALHATRLDLVKALKERASGTGADRGSRRKREVLIVAEATLAIVFLVITGMLTRMMAHVQSALSNPGFNINGLIALDVVAPEGPRRAALNREIVASLRQVPGVQSAGACDGLDLPGGWASPSRPIFVPGAPGGAGAPLALVSNVTPGLLETIQLPLLRGRSFTAEDSTSVPASAVINSAMAQRYWPGADPLGKTFKFGAAGSKEPWLTVVGVVGDTLTRNWVKTPLVYLPIAPNDSRPVEVVVRAAASPVALIPALKAAVRQIDKTQPLEDMQVVADGIDSQLRQSYFVIGITGSFAGLALLLAAAGIYGVMSYNVAERWREIGVRMALGARGGQVLRHLLGRAVALMLCGLLLGGLPPVAYALFFMGRAKMSITSGDAVLVGGAFLLLLACGTLAAFVPAYRATRVDPMIALRYE